MLRSAVRNRRHRARGAVALVFPVIIVAALMAASAPLGAAQKANLPGSRSAVSTPLPNSVRGFGAAQVAGTGIVAPGAHPLVGIATDGPSGYWLVATDGAVWANGDAGFYGSMGGKPLDAPIVGMSAVPDGRGYWLVAADGGIFSFGDAGFYGSMGGRPLNAPIVGIAATTDGKGYWEVAADGGIFSFGDAGFYGSMGGRPLNAPIVGMSASPSGRGYRLVAADGGIFSFGDAGFYGSMGGKPLNARIVGMAPSPTGRGYWLVAADGGIFSFGDAGFHGASLTDPLAPAVAITPTGGGYLVVFGFAPPLDPSTPAPQTVVAVGDAALAPGRAAPPGAGRLIGVTRDGSGRGYWEAAADGGISSFGDAGFYGSMGGKPLDAPIVGMAAMPDGAGYWLVAADGGIFSFGDAGFYGSMGGKPLDAPIVGMAAGPGGRGYWLVAADGGIFSFGDAGFHGSMGGKPLNARIVGMAATADGAGYWLVAADGGIFSFGDAAFHGALGGAPPNAPVVSMAVSPDGGGYWLLQSDGAVDAFGDAAGGLGGTLTSTAEAVGIAGESGGSGYWVAFGATNPLPALLSSYLDGRTGSVAAAIDDLDTGQTWVVGPASPQDEASIVKVDILAALLWETRQRGGLSPEQQSLAQQMIEYSDNDAATALWDDIGGAGGLSAFDAAVGMPDTTPSPCLVCAGSPWPGWGYSTTEPTDQIALLRTLVLENPLLSESERDYALGLMENVAPTEGWGVSGGIPPGVTVALKNGWLPLDASSSDWQINSIGWVSGAGADYLIAVESTGNPDEPYGIDTIDGLSSLVWSYLSGT